MTTAAMKEEEEETKEVSLKESSMNQLDTSEEKWLAKRGRDLIFGNDGDNSLPSSEPCTAEIHPAMCAPTSTAATMTTTMTSGCR
jgi:hypothetical protein